MKKIFSFLLAGLLVLSMCGCVSTSTQTNVQTVTDPTNAEDISYKDYKDTLEGLCEYMADLGYAYDFSDTTGDEADPTVMNAAMIGADKGYKFSYKYSGDAAALELYYFSDTEGEYYQQVKSEGKLTIDETMSDGTVEAFLSDSGKYMMIYHCDKENAEREEAMLKAFKGFWAE